MPITHIPQERLAWVTCPRCTTNHATMTAEDALAWLEADGQLDDWTAAWLGDGAAKKRLLAMGHSDATAIEPRAYYCDYCFETFDLPLNA